MFHGPFNGEMQKPLMNWQWEMFLESVESVFHGCGFVYSPYLLSIVWLSFRIPSNDIWFVGSKGLFSVESTSDNLPHSPLTHTTPSLPHPHSLIHFFPEPPFPKEGENGVTETRLLIMAEALPSLSEGLMLLTDLWEQGDKHVNPGTWPFSAIHDHFPWLIGLIHIFLLCLFCGGLASECSSYLSVEARLG